MTQTDTRPALTARATEIATLCELAGRFALVNRTGPVLPDGSPESDTDHTVSLTWVACTLAARYAPELDVGLVAQFAAVHDAPEVYAGDVPTQRALTRAEAAAKHAAEADAIRRLTVTAGAGSWLPRTVEAYERMDTPEARFVWAVDKIVPKVLSVITGTGVHVTRFQYLEMLSRQRVRMHALGLPRWLIDTHVEFGEHALNLAGQPAEAVSS